MIPRFTEFYIPVLKVLEDTGEHEINQLIEEVADFCNLSHDDKTILTRGGSQPRYRSNIQWAVTDLSQGVFISRSSRGVYKINFDGLLLLEENPSHPTRETLAAHSSNFRDFLNRKNTRSGKIVDDGGEGLFETFDSHSAPKVENSPERILTNI